MEMPLKRAHEGIGLRYSLRLTMKLLSPDKLPQGYKEKE